MQFGFLFHLFFNKRERERQTRRKIGDTFEYESIKIIKIIYNIIFYLFLPLKVDFTASVIAEDN
jgi:hypothetical protein